MRIFLIAFFFFTTAHAADDITFSEVKSHVERASTDVFDETGLWILGAGVLATIGAHQLDERARADFGDHRQMDRQFSKFGEFWGNGLSQLAIFGTQIYFDREKGIAGAEGMILGNLGVQALKYSVHRERPDNSESVSMPSGHTQAAFALATSMTESYGLNKAWPFWLLGIFTGAARMSDDQHWLSDVTAGAAIGILFGRAGFAHHQNFAPSVLLKEGRWDGLAASVHWEF